MQLVAEAVRAHDLPVTLTAVEDAAGGLAERCRMAVRQGERAERVEVLATKLDLLQPRVRRRRNPVLDHPARGHERYRVHREHTHPLKRHCASEGPGIFRRRRRIGRHDLKQCTTLGTGRATTGKQPKFLGWTLARLRETLREHQSTRKELPMPRVSSTVKAMPIALALSLAGAGSAHAASTTSDAGFERQVRANLAANPGSVRVGPNQIQLEPGLTMTLHGRGSARAARGPVHGRARSSSRAAFAEARLRRPLVRAMS